MVKFIQTLLLVIFVLSLHQIEAQDLIIYHPKNQPTEGEKVLDKSINDCLKSEIEFEDSFSFTEWTSTLHYYTRKMLKRLDTEHTVSIAEQKDKAITLSKLSENCPNLKVIKAELQGIQKIYENKIKIEKSKNDNDLFGEQEEIKASLDTGDAEDLLKKLEKLRKKLKITRVVIQIK